MPTYEYRCPDGHDFEQFVQKISLASSELPCPVCGKTAARRMSAGGGFVFKGSGFYITDYGKDGKKDVRDRAEQQKTAAAKVETAAKSEDAARSGARNESATQGSTSDTKSATKAESGNAGPRKAEPGKPQSGKTDSAKADSSKSAAKPAPAPPPKGGDTK